MAKAKQDPEVEEVAAEEEAPAVNPLANTMTPDPGSIPLVQVVQADEAEPEPDAP